MAAPEKNSYATKEYPLDGTLSGRCYKKEKGWWTLAMRKTSDATGQKLNLMTWIRTTLNKEAKRILGELPE